MAYSATLPYTFSTSPRNSSIVSALLDQGQLQRDNASSYIFSPDLRNLLEAFILHINLPTSCELLSQEIMRRLDSNAAQCILLADVLGWETGEGENYGCSDAGAVFAACDVMDQSRGFRYADVIPTDLCSGTRTLGPNDLGYAPVSSSKLVDA